VRLIDKLVLKDMVGPFINGLAMFTILVFSVAFLPQATDLLLQGAGIGIVLKLILLSLPEVITQTLPMAMLLAGLLGFGRLSGAHETVAIFASGVSFLRAARSILVTGVIVSVIAFLWNDYVVPPCKMQFVLIRQHLSKTMLKSDRPLDYPIRNNDNTIDKYVTIARGYDPATQALRNVTIVQYSRDPKRLGQIQAELYCDRAVANDLKAINDWTYYDGWFTVYDPANKEPGKDSLDVVQFKSMKSSPQMTPGQNLQEVLGYEITDPSAKNFHDLREEIIQDRKRGRFLDARGKEVNLYGKIALPLAGMIFGVLGAALGCNTQRGGSKTVGFGMAVFIVFLYYVFYRSMWVVGQNGGLPPILASFLADIIGFAVALYLALRAGR
jgi:lipopolysaccharide export system permease protein